MTTLSDLTRFDLVYMATPYTKYPEGITLAYIHACKLAARLLRSGIKVYSPIAHAHAIAVHGSIDPLDLSIWLPFDAALIGKSDALVVAMMTGWETSTGIRHEMDAFVEQDKPIFFLDPEDLAVKTGRR
jgi:Domain of unknown function (DUF1937)